MKRLLLLTLFTFMQLIVAAQSWQDTARRIDQLFNRYQPRHPGCQLSISRNGKVIYSNAFGLADLEQHTAYTTETVTEAGSISKQFTAAAILLLQQQGLLLLTDDVRKYIPELPKYGATITLENLLHHTSGIREWSNLAAITGWPRTTRAYRNEDVLNLLCKQKGLNNLPGTEFIYSNSNYVLLAIIVERVSRMNLADFTRKYIFIPAGMTHTSWRDDYKKVVINRGIAYAKKDNGYEINMPNESVYGPGGLLTTTEDLLKWAYFFLSGKLGNPGLLEKQLAIVKLKGGAETDYGSGLFIDTFNGVRMISHTGQTAGYVGTVENFPALQLSIAWLSNTTEFKDSLFDEVTAIEDLFIKKGKDFTPPIKPRPYPVPADTLKKHTGWYSYCKTNEGIKISLVHDTLFFKNTALISVSEDKFNYFASTIRFDNREKFTLSTADKRNLIFRKELTAEVSLQYLKNFTGTYYSKETESNFTIVLKNGKLMLEKDYLKDIPLSASYKDAFNFALILDSNLNAEPANIFFERKNKEIAGCKVSMNDARNIDFVKIRN